MRLNTIQPAEGSKHAHHRVGRGVGSGWGKTAGRGHKGQKSRAGGFHKVGFEGGQMPMYRRLPKRGFTSLSRKFVEVVRLSDLERLGLEEVDLSVLKEAGVVSTLALNARVILSGAITRKVTVRGLGVTKGARAAIEAAGGILSFGAKASQAVAMLRQGVMMNNLQLATAGAAASGMSVTNIGGASSRTFVQNIYSHDALSPAEMSTEAMAAMERDKWRLP